MKNPPSSLPDEVLSEMIVDSAATIPKTNVLTDEVSDRVRRFSELYDAIAEKPEGAALLFRDPVTTSVRSHRLGQETVVGRLSKSSEQATGSDLAVEDGKMSRKHFKITLIDGFYVLKDLDSLNGTFVNNGPQPIKENVILIAGSIVRAGDVIFIFAGK
jgi:pSer/pThr/pTyr-binding forkhead associated (FHA) protein